MKIKNRGKGKDDYGNPTVMSLILMYGEDSGLYLVFSFFGGVFSL